MGLINRNELGAEAEADHCYVPLFAAHWIRSWCEKRLCASVCTY
jgi:hypothetical protein